MINEYGAVCGMRIEGENEVLGENPPQCRTEVYQIITVSDTHSHTMCALGIIQDD
jgi:hypothetical protein